MKSHRLSTRIAILVTTLLTSLQAHESLYNTAEIHLTDPGKVTVHFSVHAPELVLDPETDFGAIGDEWLAAKRDHEIENLIKLAELFIRERYQIRIGNSAPLSSSNLEFESPALIRIPDREGGPRPGCILASLHFENTGGDLEFIYHKVGEKRLLLAVVRPAAFPITHDLEAGTSATILLPVPPVEPIPQLWYFLPIALAFAVANWMVIRRRMVRISGNS